MSYINRILNTRWFPDICPTMDEYKFLAKLLHPDVNKQPDAIDAFTHLNKLKNEYVKGMEFKDESGAYYSNYLTHWWTGDKDLLELSKQNYDHLVYCARHNFDNQSFNHFMQYIPAEFEFIKGQLRFTTIQKSMPLSKVITLLPHKDKDKHVNWIYSRMIEFVSMLESLGVTHAGLNPDSIFIEPDNHTIKIASFYHMCTDKVKTINGRYKNYYPQQVFDTKEAGSYIDLSTAKKTAICALGDISGSGVRLRTDPCINQNVLNYLLTSESDAFKSMRTWREILSQNFIKEFVVMEI